MDEIRPVGEEDRGKLLTASYSKLDLFQQCPYRYRLRYVESNFEDNRAVTLNVGSICHKVLELKARVLISGDRPDYDYLGYILHSGYGGDKETTIGIDTIKVYFFEDWYEPDSKSGMTYDQKMQVFTDQVLPQEMEDKDWHVIACEQQFDFVFNNEMILHGFIDRVDQNDNGDIRVIDYKTSKAAYDDSKLKTPLQMAIYGMACDLLYGKEPVEYWYHFVLIDDKRQACSPGYMKRAIKKIDSTYQAIKQCEKTGVYQPKPGPLCYWCSFCANNPNAQADMQYKCPYFCLWTPDYKTFEVNREYNVFTDNITTTRRLIF